MVILKRDAKTHMKVSCSSKNHCQPWFHPGEWRQVCQHQVSMMGDGLVGFRRQKVLHDGGSVEEV
jgi:hypothetical protein